MSITEIGQKWSEVLLKRNYFQSNLLSISPTNKFGGSAASVDEYENLTLNENLTFLINFSANLENLTLHSSTATNSNTVTQGAIVIFFYSLIVFVSLFGNALVCRVVLGGSASRSTTNLFIGNLSISDLLMTIFNIPLKIAAILLPNWPFGKILCSSVPFISTLSVNVSTFTMAFIALDRHQVITNPLRPRPSYVISIIRIIIIWIMAMIVSVPYAIMADVIEVESFRKMIRCNLLYPAPRATTKMWFTIITFAIQYVLPLGITAICYSKIVCIIWYRQTIGVQTENQRISQHTSKWKTIKMLMIVVVAFAICWLPLNVYHMYQDIKPNSSVWKHNSTIFFICHWFAMSSVCYNPFIYCWLNETFRKVAKSKFRWIGKIFRKSRTMHRSSLNNSNHVSHRGCHAKACNIERDSTKRTITTSIHKGSITTAHGSTRSSEIPLLPITELWISDVKLLSLEVDNGETRV